MKSIGAVVITGCSTGIGHACALRLDNLGYRVFAGVRRVADADALSKKASNRLTPLLFDVTKKEEILAAARIVDSEVGQEGLVALVNNAGICVSGPLEYTGLEEFRHQMEVNVIGLVAVTQEFLPLLKRAKGRILNIGSVAGIFSTPMLGPYCASKHAVEAVSDVLRRELRTFGIRVILLQPTAVASEMWNKALQDSQQQINEAPPAMLNSYAAVVDSVTQASKKSQKRAVSPQVVAKMITHILASRSPSSRYMVGPRTRLFRMIASLPDAIQDALIDKALGIKRDHGPSR